MYAIHTKWSVSSTIMSPYTWNTVHKYAYKCINTHLTTFLPLYVLRKCGILQNNYAFQYIRKTEPHIFRNICKLKCSCNIQNNRNLDRQSDIKSHRRMLQRTHHFLTGDFSAQSGSLRAVLLEFLNTVFTY